jgi:hypothetical protein
VTSLGAAAIAETPALAEEVAGLAQGALKSIALARDGQPDESTSDRGTGDGRAVASKRRTGSRERGAIST